MIQVEDEQIPHLREGRRKQNTLNRISSIDLQVFEVRHRVPMFFAHGIRLDDQPKEFAPIDVSASVFRNKQHWDMPDRNWQRRVYEMNEQR